MPKVITKLTNFFCFVQKLIFVYLTTVIGEGDGTPLQYSCLENPMDRGAR